MKDFPEQERNVNRKYFYFVVLLIICRLFPDTKVHSCRICATILLRQYDHLQQHLNIAHGINITDYIRRFGGTEKALEETPELQRVNSLAANLKCAQCGETLRGFQHIYDHTRQSHAKMQLTKILLKVQKPLGLLNCDSCMRNVPLIRGTLELHAEFFHTARRNEKEVETEGLEQKEEETEYAKRQRKRLLANTENGR